MVIPTTSTSWRAVLTASSRCGLIIASTFFIQSSSWHRLQLGVRDNRVASCEFICQRALDGFCHLVRQCQAITVRYIEDIKRIALFGRDPGANDLQPQVGENARNLVSETGLVDRVDFDEGGRYGCFIVTDHLRKVALARGNDSGSLPRSIPGAPPFN